MPMRRAGSGPGSYSRPSAPRARARLRLAVWMVSILVAAGAAPPVRAGSAGVDVNQAPLADLESVRGIGPALAERIVSERARAPFADWADLTRRVRGVGPAAAARLSAAGLTVGGRSLAGGPQAADPASAPGGR